MKIEIVEENHVRLIRGSEVADAWARWDYGSAPRWYFTPSSTNKRYYVGWWINWRVNRVQHKALRQSFWSKLPQATLVGG